MQPLTWKKGSTETVIGLYANLPVIVLQKTGNGTEYKVSGVIPGCQTYIGKSGCLENAQLLATGFINDWMNDPRFHATEALVQASESMIG